MTSTFAAGLASRISNTKDTKPSNSKMTKCRAFSQDVLERRDRKKYSAYGARDYAQSTTHLHLHNTSITAPKKKVIPAKSCTSMATLPSVEQSNAKSPVTAPRKVPQRQSAPMSKKSSTIESMTASPTQPEQKTIDKHRQKLIEMLDKFKAALLAEETEKVNSENSEMKVQHQYQDSVACESRHLSLSQPKHAPPNTCNQCGNSTTEPSTLADRYITDHFAKFLQPKEEMRNDLHSSRSTINSTSSDNTDIDDSGYKTGSPMSTSSATSVNSIRRQRHPEPKIYRSELNISLIPANSLSVDHSANHGRINFTFDFNDDAMMSEYEQEAFDELLRNAPLYSDVDSEDEEACILDMGVLKDDKKCSKYGMFDKMENELAIISKSLNHSANVIRQLSFQ